MEGFIIGLSLTILIVLLIIFILKTKEINRLTLELKKLNSEGKIEKLRLSLPNKNIENLIIEINTLIDDKRKMENIYKEKDMELREAIANMSHDLRTPLTSIMGYVYLLNDDKLDKEERKEYLKIIEKRSLVLNDLITNFYGLSRIQADQYEIKFKPVNLELVLGEIIAAFYETLDYKFGEPEINIEEGLGPVLGDKQALNRIFTNLIENIIKHGEGEVKISLKKKNKYIVMEFSNKAEDLESKDVNRIFEKFFTKDRMRTGQNTGLGLAIVKLLVEKQGQKIEAKKVGNRLVINIIWSLES
ncbi:TPA: HAMP domain-containing sensor histidine kinase [Clostridium perfringens]|uniref:sensor histidine kinase n=2 Tax=Clostridium perfringens TaxID=1502 RepID=UPI0010098D98|nr:HAMP domain-containing sensor histidine kinase [Clostridium perfringens]EJT5939896.1 HAMP domain-containing histidine kinase [Clostridium perfringens]EJT6151743.1 HAMP domain-containing histidine kinase [Clostridium perfringens]EJT6157429.1 HAMP domain-containing histidine kinase [Clostridium perfringens]EJT6471949.1 HAMP domain-containing histidine kinase [Clostridium perfringens]MDG6877121.1 Alkaline phosphatase synthesis sensor protein PhoR [Clostridium perfringens]